MTGLANRAFLIDRLAHVVTEARREHRLAAVLFIDLDFFRHVNNNHGHDQGDAVLCQVAERLKGCLSETDTLCRTGDDEFVFVIERLESVESSMTLANVILETFARPFDVKGRQLSVTASIGMSLYPHDASTSEQLMRFANVATHHAKESGGNALRRYETDMHARLIERLALEEDLRHALERKELELHYQPILASDTLNVVAAEALVRWQHPSRGLIFPDQFIGTAEETGLIVPVGEWVLRQACAQAERWSRKWQRPPRIAVNLSARQFLKLGLIETVARALHDSKLPARLLTLELTESSIMKDLALASETLAALRSMGVQVSLDDFGTGYSSLGYLKALPIDAIKIDRSFASGLSQDLYDQAIARTVVTLAHSIGLPAIAEGVETDQQLEILRKLQYDFLQGFLFSKPLEAAAFECLLDGSSALSASAQ